jgi:hypothetical protein
LFDAKLQKDFDFNDDKSNIVIARKSRNFFFGTDEAISVGLWSERH